jgi:biopolymer transport protein ExbB
MDMKNAHKLLLVLGLLIMAAALPAAWAQGTSAAAAAAAPAPGAPVKPPHKDKTLIQVIKDGGVMMIPLLATSVIMMALVMNGFISLKKKKLVPDQDLIQLRSFFNKGDYQGALAYCKTKPGFLNSTVAAGLTVVGQGQEVAQQAMGDALAKEVSVLSTRNYYLNLIGVVTPMLGLTGTVLGMIKAFSTLGESGIGDPSRLAGAIGEVLVATATGLFVAVPGFSFYYVFRNWIIEATAYAEDQINYLFRGMPYAEMAGMWFDQEPVVAALPQEVKAAPAEDAAKA